jgi:signal transduction histidine kinase
MKLLLHCARLLACSSGAMMLSASAEPHQAVAAWLDAHSGADLLAGLASRPALAVMVLFVLFVLPGVAAFAFGWLLFRYRRLREALANAERRLAEARDLRAGERMALLDSQDALRRLIANQDEIRISERWRIARDIHDDLGQHLLALKMDLAALAQHPFGTGASAVQQRLGMISGNVDTAVKSLRYIINDLRPAALDAGLRTALERQLAEFARVNGHQVEFTVQPGALEQAVGRHLDAALLRIVQESLSNIARHARAGKVSVSVACLGGQLTMAVRDDGIGMPAGPLQAGCGLMGIEDRAAAAGGRFSIVSEPGSGTELLLAFPLSEAQHFC